MAIAAVLGALVALAIGIPSAAATTSTPPPASPGSPLVLAHYYIWFTANSWNRAKIDYPLKGRYASDEASTMRAQVREAKSAGIDGFIVSWKSTPDLDRRLAQLVDIAREEQFKLAITYQGLDFTRRPLPAARVARDLTMFADRYAGDSVFALFGDRPVVAWSGTWESEPAAVKEVVEPLRDRLQILGTEQSVRGVEALAGIVEGEMYYWASVNPSTMDRYQAKLHAMADATRKGGGLWIAPAAPGFDARQVGGTSEVPRLGGATLRTEWQAAMNTMPDAIGIISWNEFSENTHIEPSDLHGREALDVIAALTGAPLPSGDLDSDGPVGSSPNLQSIAAIAGLVALLVISGTVIRRRARMAAGQQQVVHAE